MLPNRIHLTKQASEQLKFLKARTGITPNILARIALARSLKEGYDYTQHEDLVLDGLEFLIPTLLGDYALLYERLLIERHRIKDSQQLALAIVAHIENGLGGIRNVRDFGELLGQL